MARRYTVASGQTSLAAATTRVACQLATGSTVTGTVVGFDVTFDSTATGAGAIPVRVQLARPTGASSGGASATPVKMNKAFASASATARTNDTSAGASPTVIAEWHVLPTSGLCYLFPLNREVEVDVSDFLELKLISQTGMTSCNYNATLWFEE